MPLQMHTTQPGIKGTAQQGRNGAQPPRTNTLSQSPHTCCSRSTPEREDPVVVSPDDAEPADGQRLGAIPLGEDERAQVAVAGAGLVGVIELGNA